MVQHPRIKEVSDERDAGNGYQVELNPGWKDGYDQLCPTHFYSAATQSVVLKIARRAMPCDCDDCKTLLCV